MTMTRCRTLQPFNDAMADLIGGHSRQTMSIPKRMPEEVFQ
jgi:hypothetical protein